MKKLKITFFMFSSIFLSACNDKEDVRTLLEKAEIKYQEKDYYQTHQLLEKAAKLGSGEAEYQLSKLYALGQGVEKNTNRYFQLLENSAKKGELKALKSLGAEYYSGNVITRDYGKAFPLFKEAALRGDVDSQVYLGRMYHYGNGVEKDYVKALEWYRKAANENDTGAILEIGRMYRDGKGVKQDLDMAIATLQSAIKDSNKIIDISTNATISVEIADIYTDAYFKTKNDEYGKNAMYWSEKFREFSKKEKELLNKQ